MSKFVSNLSVNVEMGNRNEWRFKLKLCRLNDEWPFSCFFAVNGRC